MVTFFNMESSAEAHSTGVGSGFDFRNRIGRGRLYTLNDYTSSDKQMREN